MSDGFFGAFTDGLKGIGSTVGEIGTGLISQVFETAEATLKTGAEGIRQAVPIWAGGILGLQTQDQLSNPLGSGNPTYGSMTTVPTTANPAEAARDVSTWGNIGPFSLANLSTMETIALGVIGIGGVLLALRMARIL